VVGLAWRAPVGEGPVGVPPSLADWRALLDSPDGVFVGLEPAGAAAELDVARGRSSATLVADGDLDPDGDLDELAVRLAALDLVIGPDTPTVRLAAALGVETWVLLPPVPGWIWFEGHDESPWSPALRLFRAAPGEGWQPTLRAVALALARRRGEG
jgi:ADP-heptose:LPS heptosyltransferase